MLKKFFVWSLIFCMMLLLSDEVSAKFKYPAPNPSTEFHMMDYPQLYPTYSWEPLPNTEFYQVQIFRDNKLIRELKNTEAFNKVTDLNPYTVPGKYYWQVRAVDKKNNPLSDWSEKSYFTVETPVTFAVLGDSISHGGANFIPSGQLACQWETFCDVPVKNLARSGDTTLQMLERFDNDVLPFSPKVLIIFGGTNDIRNGYGADYVIKNLEALREKCLANNITPIFVTIPPMNEKIIRSRNIFITDSDWRTERTKLNSWIIKNGGIEISWELVDFAEELRADLTPDGLHPALRGKMSIGKAIEIYLHEKFPALITKKIWEIE